MPPRIRYHFYQIKYYTNTNRPPRTLTFFLQYYGDMSIDIYLNILLYLMLTVFTLLVTLEARKVGRPFADRCPFSESTRVAAMARVQRARATGALLLCIGADTKHSAETAATEPQQLSTKHHWRLSPCRHEER